MSETARCPECGETLFQSELARFDRFFDGYLECHCGQLVPEVAKKPLQNKPTPTELPAQTERSLTRSAVPRINFLETEGVPNLQTFR